MNNKLEVGNKFLDSKGATHTIKKISPTEIILTTENELTQKCSFRWFELTARYIQTGTHTNVLYV